jgi:hypothetical protein
MLDTVNAFLFITATYEYLMYGIAEFVQLLGLSQLFQQN